MNLDELRAFIAVIEAGSFSSAATALGMSRSTLRRRIEALEGRAGVQLVVRGGGFVTTTGAGDIVMTQGRLLMQRTHALLEGIREDSADQPSVLRIAGQSPMGDLCGRLVSALRAEAPHLRIEVRLVLDPLAELLEGADLAVHVAPAPHGPWDTHFIGTLRERLFAPRSYLEAAGTPTVLEDLVHHRLMNITALGETPHLWPLLDGRHITIEPLLTSRNIDVLVGAMLSHGAIALLPSALAAALDAEGHDMVPVLADIVGSQRAFRVTVPERLADLKVIRSARGVVVASIARWVEV